MKKILKNIDFLLDIGLFICYYIIKQWDINHKLKGSKMKYYGKSQEVCDAIIETFKNGSLPEKLSLVFINHKGAIPSEKWSFLNRFVMVCNGTDDARTFKQWNSVGRKVRKGAKAFAILGPCIKHVPSKEKDENGKEKLIPILYGFKSIAVFKISDTEVYDQEKWEKHSNDSESKEKIENLPLREVAEKWGLDVSLYNGKGTGYLGYYQHGKKIALGVENLAVWAHELVHAADDKNGSLVKQFGQNASNEIVAEFGANVLLKILGFENDVDLGGAWNYIQRYAEGSADKTIKEINKVITRICNAVDLILTTSDEIVNETK